MARSSGGGRPDGTTGPSRRPGPAGAPGFLETLRASRRHGSAGRFSTEVPPGRAERLGLGPVLAPRTSVAESIPSRVVHGGDSHRIGSELAGDRDGRTVVLFDLWLDSAVGARNDSVGGSLTHTFHVAAVGLDRPPASWCAAGDHVREHLLGAGHGARLRSAGWLSGVRVFGLDRSNAVAALPDAVRDWLGRQGFGREIARRRPSMFEVAGPWALVAIPMARMELPDEMAEELAARTSRGDGAGAWPERLLGLAAEFADRLRPIPR